MTLAHPRTVRSGRAVRHLRDGDQHVAIDRQSGQRQSRSARDFRRAARLGPERLVRDHSGGPVGDREVPAEAAADRRRHRSSFTGEADGGIRLFTGVGERGVPLAPNAIVLPTSTDALPPSLVAAAQRVLGQAFSIATAPAEALPPDVLFVRRQTVIDRGLELAEAGQRLQFGDTAGRRDSGSAARLARARASSTPASIS